MTLTFYLLWLVCALGAVVFAAAGAHDVRRMALIGAGFAASVVLVSPAGFPDAATVGTLTMTAAAIHLFRPRFAAASAVFGGALAGLWSALLELQGVPSMLTPPVAATLLAVSIWLARSRPTFAPERLCEEGLLGVGFLGLGVAVLPGILDGWQAATNLAAAQGRDQALGVPAWTAVLLLTSTLLGAMYAVWSRR